MNTVPFCLFLVVVLLFLGGVVAFAQGDPVESDSQAIQSVLGVSLLEANSFPRKTLKHQKTSHEFSLGLVRYRGDVDVDDNDHRANSRLRWGKFLLLQALFGLEDGRREHSRSSRSKRGERDDGGFRAGARLGTTFGRDPWGMVVQVLSLEAVYRSDWRGSQNGIDLGAGIDLRLMNHWSWAPVRVSVHRYWVFDDAGQNSNEEWGLRIGFLSFLLPL